MSSQEKKDNKKDVKKNDNEIKSESEEKKKAVVAKRKKRRKRRRASPSEAARDELDMCRTVQQRYGAKKRVQDEIKEAVFNPSTGQIFHPASYERMMKRSVEAHLNRMLQPEPPGDLVGSNWLCAFCLKPSFADNQGELYGPYFVRLSMDCQPPAELLAISCYKNAKSTPEEASSSATIPHRGHSNVLPSNKLGKRVSPPKCSASVMATTIQGSLDVWLHGDCALWAPELFLVGGRLPTLQCHIQRYWQQKCFVCSGVGATIPITYSQNDSEPQSASKRGKKGSDAAEHHFLHYKCALQNGCLLNALTYVCRPPLSKSAES